MTHEKKLKDFIRLVMFGAQQRIDPAALLERVTGIPSATMPIDVAAELATIAADTLKETR